VNHPPAAGGARTPLSRSADAAAAGTLVVFVVALGLAPHAWFSDAVGQLVFFKGAYDEDTYFLYMLRGIFEPYRVVSHHFLAAVHALAGRSADLTLIAADLMLPALATVAAYFLASQLVRDWRIRAVVTLLLLFGQEFFSLANVAVWAGRAPPIELFRSLFGIWGAMIVPSPEVSYLGIFRTPEPQLGYAVVFVVLALLIRIANNENRALDTVVLAALSFCLPFIYIIVSLPTLMAEACAAALLVAMGRRRAATALTAIVLGAAAVFGLTILLSANTQTGIFASRLPIVTPGVLLGAMLVVPVAVSVLRWRSADPSAWLGVGFLAVPVVLSNQQVVTGLMISARDWERNINYQFLLIGLALIAHAFFADGLRRHRRALGYASLAVALCLAFVLARAQAQSYRYWLPSNLISVAMARVSDTVKPLLPDRTRVLLDEPGLAPLLAVRTGDNFEFVLDFTKVFQIPTPPIDETGRPPRRPHESDLFEYWWRTGTSPEEAEKLLTAEAAQRAGFFLAFLFNILDYWHPASDNRIVRQAEIVRNIPEIVMRYEAYRARPPAGAGEPIMFLTSKDPAKLATPAGLRNTLLSTGRAAGTIIYAYRQERAD
jgi:hypothetical protein